MIYLCEQHIHIAMKKYWKVIFNEYEEMLNCFCACAPWGMADLVLRVTACKVKHFACLRIFVGNLIYLQEEGHERPFHFTKCVLTFPGGCGDSKKHNSYPILHGKKHL